jgi:hypothetical protein
LPDACTPEPFDEKAGAVFQHVYENGYDGGASVKARMA